MNRDSSTTHDAQKWIDYSKRLIAEGKTPTEADAICAAMIARKEEPPAVGDQHRAAGE